MGFDAAGRLPGAYISSCFCLFICIYYVYYSYVYTLYIYTQLYMWSYTYIYIYINNQVCIGFHKKTSRCLQFILETNWPWNGLGPWWWWWWYRCVSKIRGLTNENRNTLMIQSEYHEIQQTNYSISKSDALIWVCLKNGGFTFKLWPV